MYSTYNFVLLIQVQDLKDQNALLKTQKPGQMNGHSEPSSAAEVITQQANQSSAELESMKSELAQKDTSIAQLSQEVGLVESSFYQSLGHKSQISVTLSQIKLYHAVVKPFILDSVLL